VAGVVEMRRKVTLVEEVAPVNSFTNQISQFRELQV